MTQAEAAHRAEIERNPLNVSARNYLAICLAQEGRFAEAIDVWREALRIQPNAAEVAGNLANLYFQMGRIDEALEAARASIQSKPDFASGWNTLGAALAARGEYTDAIAAYRKAIEATPDFAWAHFNLALALLLTGQYAEGWEEWEWRLAMGDSIVRRMPLRQPRWNGEALNGRKILLFAEQGIGDAIQFMRYIPLVKERGGQIVLLVPSELISLCTRLPGVDEVVLPGPWPDFDFQCPLMSLTRVFGTRVESVPFRDEYLKPQTQFVEMFKPQVDAIGPGKKVGIVWAGRPEFGNDRNRSMKLPDLAPLGSIDGVQLISLQKGDAARQLANPPGGMKVLDLLPDPCDFATTAGLVANLDLVISVDTAVAHLAGAMGKPVWVLLPFSPDWRWGLNRQDSAWYTSARTFRQTTAGDWTTVVAAVCDALKGG